jgi:hypothetical protein
MRRIHAWQMRRRIHERKQGQVPHQLCCAALIHIHIYQRERERERERKR